MNSHQFKFQYSSHIKLNLYKSDLQTLSKLKHNRGNPAIGKRETEREMGLNVNCLDISITFNEYQHDCFSIVLIIPLFVVHLVDNDTKIL